MENWRFAVVMFDDISHTFGHIINFDLSRNIAISAVVGRQRFTSALTHN